MPTKRKIFLTRSLTPVAMERLKQEFDLSYNSEDRVLTKDEIISGIKEVDGVLCLLTDTIDQAVMESNPNLKIISNYAVGFNNIDIAQATKRGIPVGYTPDTLTETTADLTWALILATARRIVESDHFLREGLFKGWGPNLLLGTDVYGKTLGIVGMGRIGQAVARRAQGFNMPVLYTSRKEKNIPGAKRVSLDELLETSDFVSIHVPYHSETHHLIDAHAFMKMKSSSFLINTARGPIVHEEDLVVALKDKTIAGAGLDVFEHEPKVHPGLMTLKQVVILPHVGSATEATRTNMAMMAIDNLHGILTEGYEPKAIANPEVFH